MLEILQARELIRTMSGSKKPCLFLCEGKDQQNRAVVVKFRETVSRNKISLVLEVLCWHLARHFNLSVPDAYIINVPSNMGEFTENMAYASAINSSPGLNFGSEFIKNGSATMAFGKDFEEHPPQWAEEIFAFDFSIRNLDRQATNRNLLYNGSDYYLIDHEESFKDYIGVREANAFNPDPFFQHVFWSILTLVPNLSLFYSNLGNITHDLLNHWIADCPEEWRNKQNEIEDIVDYVIWVRDNLPLLKASIQDMVV